MHVQYVHSRLERATIFQDYNAPCRLDHIKRYFNILVGWGGGGGGAFGPEASFSV